MSYTAQVWKNGPSSGTPINATRLNYMEAGIGAAAVSADNANSALATLETEVAAEYNALSNDTTTALRALRTQLFGGPNRTKPYQSIIAYSADYSMPINSDVFAAASGNWTAFSDPDSMLRSGAATGGAAGFVRMIIPVSGWWELEYLVLGDTQAGLAAASAIEARTDSTNPTISDCIAFDTFTCTGPTNLSMNPRIVAQLPAGMAIYWSTWCGTNSFMLRGTKFNARTQIRATFRGGA